MAKRVKKPGKLRPTRTIVARGELARILSVSPRTVNEWRAAGLPQEADGRYCVEDCREWAMANDRRTTRPQSADMPGVDPSLRAAWETKLTMEKARQEEIRRAELEGRMIDVDVPAREAERRIAHAKALLEQIPDRLLGLLPRKLAAKVRKTIRAQLADWIAAALSALADEADLLASRDEEAVVA